MVLARGAHRLYLASLPPQLDNGDRGRDRKKAGRQKSAGSPRRWVDRAPALPSFRLPSFFPRLALLSARARSPSCLVFQWCRREGHTHTELAPREAGFGSWLSLENTVRRTAGGGGRGKSIPLSKMIVVVRADRGKNERTNERTNGALTLRRRKLGKESKWDGRLGPKFYHTLS